MRRTLGAACTKRLRDMRFEPAGSRRRLRAYHATKPAPFAVFALVRSAADLPAWLRFAIIAPGLHQWPALFEEIGSQVAIDHLAVGHVRQRVLTLHEPPWSAGADLAQQNRND